MSSNVTVDAAMPGQRAVGLINGKLEDYTANLERMVKVPPERVVEFLSSSDLELEQQAILINRIVLRFTAIAKRVEKGTITSGGFLESLDPKVFSRDHEWRSIVSALSKKGIEYTQFKTVTLNKYLQYLRFRQDLLHYILDRRSRNHRVRTIAQSNRSDNSFDAIGEPRETDAFDRPATQCQPMASDKYIRLPRKETKELYLERDDVLELFLASHRFRLSWTGEDLELVDEKGVTYFLHPGKYTVGRHSENSIVIDQDFREISRYHMVISWQGDEAIHLTDISNFGTFVVPGRLSISVCESGRSELDA